MPSAFIISTRPRFTRLKPSVKPAFKILCSQRESHWVWHLCCFVIHCVFKRGAVDWFKYFIGQFYCSCAPRLFKARTNFLNQIDKCKVIALEITAAQGVGPEFPLGLFNYLPKINLEEDQWETAVQFYHKHPKPFSWWHLDPKVYFPEVMTKILATWEFVHPPGERQSDLNDFSSPLGIWLWLPPQWQNNG